MKKLQKLLRPAHHLAPKNPFDGISQYVTKHFVAVIGKSLAATFLLISSHACAVPPAEVTSQAGWPANADALQFIWEDANAQNEILDADGKVIRICRLQPRGRARYGRYSVMKPAGGWFETEPEIGADLTAACEKTGELSIELVITPDRSYDAKVQELINFGSRNFTLRRHLDHLQFHLQTSLGLYPINFGRLVPGQPLHVVITYSPGKLVSYVNGRQAEVLHAERAELSTWQPQRISFCGTQNATSNWTGGTMEAVILYSRELNRDEIARNYRIQQGRVEDRQPADRLVIQAKLLEKTVTPSVKDVAPYDRALAVYTYAVEDILRGVCKESKIQVAHWVIMDRQTLSIDHAVGDRVRLALESFTDHEQLESERLVSDSDEFELPLYYAIE